MSEVRQPLRDGLIIGLTQAVVLAAFVFAVTVGVANQQAKNLSAIREATELTVHVDRAFGCELGVPSLDGTRDQTLLRLCWTNEDLTPPAFPQG